jgi:TPR repeat protein
MAGGRRAPRRRRDRSWLTVAALLVLAVVAAAVWVLPKLPQLGVQFEKKPDFVQQLPGPGSTARRETASVDKIENLPLNKPGDTKPAVGESTGTVLPEPPSQHVTVYRQAATAGNVKAQIALAQLYLRGDGVAKDPAEAARWYREAASKHNDANAQYALGVLLDRGIGVDKDPIEALLWFQRAAQQGHPAALTNTGVAYSRGEVVPRDYAKAATYFRRAAEAGVAQAQFNLGLLCENGWGVEKDPVQAYRWYSAAAKGGDPGAGQALERLAPTMSADDLARAKELVSQAAAGKP